MEPLSCFIWLPYKDWGQQSFEGFSCMSSTVFGNERFPQKKPSGIQTKLNKTRPIQKGLLINYLDPTSFLLTSQKPRMDKKTDRSEAYPLHSLGVKLWNCTGIPQTVRWWRWRWWRWWRWWNAALLTCLNKPTKAKHFCCSWEGIIHCNAQVGWRRGLVYEHTYLNIVH